MGTAVAVASATTAAEPLVPLGHLQANDFHLFLLAATWSRYLSLFLFESLQ
jgi:hypothetical protein